MSSFFGSVEIETLLSNDIEILEMNLQKIIYQWEMVAFHTFAEETDLVTCIMRNGTEFINRDKSRDRLLRGILIETFIVP